MIANIQIADDIPMPVMLLSGHDFSLAWINQAGQSWLKSSLKSLTGKSLDDLFKESEALVSAAEKAKAYQTPVHIQEVIVKPRQTHDEKCEISAFLHEDQIGLVFSRQGRQTQKENIFEDGASALGRLLAHEIKNPLAGIQGAAQLLRDDVDGEEALSLLTLIESEISRIRRLADRMERLGDVAPSEFRPVNIHEILRHARKVMQSGIPKNIVFTEHYDPSLPMAMGDEDSLTQTIMNLIKNASEALGESSDNPEIRLETSYRTSGVGLPIAIRVSDNGAGIPEHLRDKIFHPFITDKPQGQGLGLALVSKVVAAHGGAVEVQSHAGETIFSILLPNVQRSPS